MKLRNAFRFFAFVLAPAIFPLLPSRACYAQESHVQSAPAAISNSADHVKASSNDDDPKLQHRNPRYRIQHSDILAISFPLSPEFDQSKVTVQPDGYINLINAGSVYVEGMTVPEAVVALKKAYAGILHDPIIDVDLVDFQRPFFLVSGQVGKPGQYELRHETTLSEAIAMAGGFPMVIVEAFACGTPVLCSRLGSMQELIFDGLTGLHFTPGDAHDLAQKVAWAWNHPVELSEMGRRARCEYERQYTAARNYAQLIKIYETALSRSLRVPETRVSKQPASSYQF